MTKGQGRRRLSKRLGDDEIDEIDPLPFSSITDDDPARTGQPYLGALRRRAAHAGPIDDDTVLYRVEFHACGNKDDAMR